MNKQNKIANQVMKKYFCTFINYEQNDWLEKLAMTKFSMN